MLTVLPEKPQHILRVMNTSSDGRRKMYFTITSIRGVGRRFATVVRKMASVDIRKRAGRSIEEEVEQLLTSMTNPFQCKILDLFLNRQKDIKDGCYTQVPGNAQDKKLGEDLERLRKIRAHKGPRHYWGIQR